jgi:hypothetical protein
LFKFPLEELAVTVTLLGLILSVALLEEQAPLDLAEVLVALEVAPSVGVALTEVDRVLVEQVEQRL